MRVENHQPQPEPESSTSMTSYCTSYTATTAPSEVTVAAADFMDYQDEVGEDLSEVWNGEERGL